MAKLRSGKSSWRREFVVATLVAICAPTTTKVVTTTYWSSPVRAQAPLGFFYHEPLRDARKIVGLAGGSGITPFRSIARQIAFGDLDAELLLLYGSSDEEDIVF